MDEKDRIFSEEYVEEEGTEGKVTERGEETEVSYDFHREIDEDKYWTSKPKRIVTRVKISNG